MKVECEIVMEYDSEDVARTIFEAVRKENEGFVESSIDGGKITFTAVDDNPMSLSHTINDLLGCIKAAENSIGVF